MLKVVIMEYNININNFQGPLDLLLHLIKKDNIDIYDISIDKITKDYFDYIHKMESLNIDVASSYFIMAAELMEIKSSSLLPSSKKEEEEEEEENSRDKLINKLLEYQKYKELTSYFKEKDLTRKKIFVKSPENLKEYKESGTPLNKGEITDLISAFNKFLERKELEKPLSTKITTKEYSIKERKESIIKLLKQNKKLTFTSLFETYSKPYIVVTFLSILDMVKEGIIDIVQNQNFSEITVEMRDISC